MRQCLYFLKVDIPLLSSPQCHGRLQQGNIVEVMWIILQECVPKRIGEQISDVAVPPIQEVIVVVTQPNPQDCISVRIADLLVPQT